MSKSMGQGKLYSSKMNVTSATKKGHTGGWAALMRINGNLI